MPRNPRSNLGQLIKDECVRRFESVVTDEIRSYNLLTKNQNNKISRLDERVDLLQSELEKEKLDKFEYFLKTDELFKNSIKSIENTYQDLTVFIKQNNKELHNVKILLDEKIDSLVSLEHFDKSCVELENNIDHVDVEMHILSTHHEKEMHKNDKKYLAMFEDLSNKIEDFSRKVEQCLSDFERKVDEYVVDAKGVLKELQVYKKEAYIQDKKIENLYTLIDRLKSERG